MSETMFSVETALALASEPRGRFLLLVSPCLMLIPMVIFARWCGFHVNRRNLAASIVPLALAAVYFCAWLRPGVLPPALVDRLAWFIPVEILAILLTLCVVALFTTNRGRDLWFFLSMVLSIVVLIGTIVLMARLDAIWPLFAVPGLAAVHFFASAKAYLDGRDASSAWLWLGRVGVAAVLATLVSSIPLPPFGWLPELPARQDYLVIAFGFFYFLFVVLFVFTHAGESMEYADE